MRYAFIEGVCAECVVKAQESREALRSVRIDKVLTDKYAAIPVFVGIMALIFWLTFSVIGKWLSELLSMGIDWLTGVVDAALTAYGLNPVVHSLLINGVFAGVGSVLSFLPIIVVLFFFLSILEDTGYMAGHFIVIYGYGIGEFRVYDPSSVARSGETWSYARLEPQIAQLWCLTAD